MKRKCTLLFLMLATWANAQESLTLSRAINYALKHKKEAVQAKLEYQDSENKIAEVRSAALPQVALAGSLTYNPIIQQVAMPNFLKGLSQIFNNLPGGGKSPFPDTGDADFILLKMGTEWQTNAVVSVSQQLFNQSVFTGLKAARTTREFFAINKELTDEKLIEKVAIAYYQVYQIQLKLKTVQTNLESTSKVRDVIDGLYQNGLAKKIDLDRIVVAINNLKAMEQQVLNAKQLQENALKFIIGMDINQAILLPENTFGVSSWAFAEHNDFSVNNRTEIKLLSKQLDLLELNKKAFQAESYPRLSLSGTFGYLGQGNQFPWFKGEKEQVFYTNFSAISLNLSIPIFNGFATRSRVRQANIAIEKAKAEKADAALALNLDFNNAKTQMNNSLLMIDSQFLNVVLAQEVLSNIKNNYNNGLASLTDLLDAEKALTEAQNNYTNALLEYKLAEVQLIKSQGKLHTLTQENQETK